MSRPQALLIAAATLVALAAVWRWRRPLARGVVSTALRLVYRVEIDGLEHVRAALPQAVIAANHASFLDGLLLGAFLPGNPVFAVDTFIARKWWARPFLSVVDALPVDPTNPLSIRAMIRAVENGSSCVIFPEGRITVTGALMKVYDGPALIAERTRAALVLVRIDGAELTPFSRLAGKVPRHLFPKIRITVFPARRLAPPEGLTGRARRAAMRRALHDEMVRAAFATARLDTTLYDALLEARARHGAGHLVADDIEQRPMSYRTLITASRALGSLLEAMTQQGQRVGVLLPTSRAAVVTFFALQAIGRVPALLNFAAGPAASVTACAAARLTLVITARTFVERARLQPLIAALEPHTTVIYLEDLRREIGMGRRVAAMLRGMLDRPRRRPERANEPAAVLFTSGSEGAPKGVVLSHRNLLANCYQLASVIDINPKDVALNALPMFHSFGLTGGVLLPLVNGVFTFFYPSPLHYRTVSELAYGINATVLFGTDTFLAGYARVADDYDFYSVRFVFAGAERVRPETRRIWFERFGLRLLEGYGTTETSPVLAVNTPMHFKVGTVGRLLPGIEYRVDPVEGIPEGGRLSVRGPNVMLGYLRVERPGVLDPPEGGWHDTGDIVSTDGAGFVTIRGRAKRFAKIAGEMVSLGAIEELASTVWPGSRHAVVAVPDPRRGEQLVMVTEQPAADRVSLAQAARSAGLPELFVPRLVVLVDLLPTLSTGKTDYVSVIRTALDAAGQASSDVIVT